MATNKLNEAFCVSVKPADKATKYSDGGGLCLEVMANGQKRWRINYRYGGKQQTLSAGIYPTVTLKMARKSRDEVKRNLALGLNPSLARKIKKAETQNTFKVAAVQWFNVWSVGKSPVHAQKVWTRIERDIIKKIGDYPLAQITTSVIVDVVKSVAGRGAYDVAKRVRQNIEEIYSYAITHGLTTTNPATGINIGHIVPNVPTKHQTRLDAEDVGQLMKDIYTIKTNELIKLLMLLMAHTFVRTSELIGARWCDVDFDAKRWTIPARIEDATGAKVYGMKMNTPHTVPLSKQTIEILHAIKMISGGGVYLFPAMVGGKDTINQDTIIQTLYSMGYKGRMTGHGFRGIASTQLHEMGFEHDIIELQLSHVSGNEVSRAYNAAQKLEARAEMMQAYSDWLDSERKR